MKFLSKYVKQTGGGKHEIRIWRSQIGVLLLYVSALSIAFFKQELLFAAVALFALISVLGFDKYNNSEKYFFGGLAILGVLLSATSFFFSQFNFLLLVAYTIVFAAFFVGFYIFFRRDWVEGTVEAYSGKWAVVHVPYDIQSGVRQGWYAVRTKRKLRSGQKVKARVKGILGERVPWEITS